MVVSGSDGVQKAVQRPGVCEYSNACACAYPKAVEGGKPC